MKTDIDRLMQKYNIDYLLVTGSGGYNPFMVYLTGGGHFSDADLIKKRGELSILFHYAIERDEAAKTGIPTRSFSNYPIEDILNETKGDYSQAIVRRYLRMFNDLGIISGRVAIYGQIDLGKGYSVFTHLAKSLPGLEFVGFQNEDLMMWAMATKSPDEVERIRRIGMTTTEVVGKTSDYLSHLKEKDNVLVGTDGEPVTIGKVKRLVNLWLIERGAENPEGMIFSIGHDSAVPHSCGNTQDFLRLGETIIFDIYPSEAGGGYYYDMTRTWSLGYATDEVYRLHNQVSQVLEMCETRAIPGTLFKDIHIEACRMFSNMGHPTIITQPGTEDGYVHSLGHGVGLHIHEMPFSGISATSNDVLCPGSVFTLEPGLYYPKENKGVRIEDTYWMAPDGKIQILAQYPRNLVIEIKS